MSDDFMVDGFDGMDDGVFSDYIEESSVNPESALATQLSALDTYADLVYCIDLTGSMAPIIRKVKQTARTLHQELQKKMRENYNREIIQLRIKVIGFRDIYVDGSLAFEESRFFNLPAETDEFQDFVDKLEAKGGGDIPESSLEAIAKAMQVDWCRTIDDSIRKRHVIVLFTDASAHPLEKAFSYTGTNYPANMPDSYSSLVDMWFNQNSEIPVTIDQTAKRIAIFAPEGLEPWGNLSEDFNVSYFQPIDPNNGGVDITTKEIIIMLSETLS